MACRPTGVFERRIDEVNSSPFRKSSTAWAVSACIASLALSACGGGGGSESAASASGPTLSGQAVKGPVSGGQVCAYTLQTPRQQIVCATTDSKSNYQLQLPAGTGEVLLEVTGGSYVDEATGKTVNLTTPLRTVTKAAALLENVLLTPFTELAVQRAAAAHPAGQLSFVSFQSKINELETGLGLSGLADGKPFGGSSTQDADHQKALAAFAKLQAGNGKDVAGALQIMGSQLDQCGVNSLGVTLAAYSAGLNLALTGGSAGSGTTVGSGSGVGTISIGSGGGLQLASVPSSLPSASADIKIRADLLNLNLPPELCTNSFSISGVDQNVQDLFQSQTPSAWASATQVDATLCGATGGLNMNFPLATVNLKAKLETTGMVNIIATLGTGGGGIINSRPIPSGTATIGPGMNAINLASSGLTLSKACYQSNAGATFATTKIVTSPTLSIGSGSGSLSVKSGDSNLQSKAPSGGLTGSITSSTGSVLITAPIQPGSVSTNGGSVTLTPTISPGITLTSGAGGAVGNLTLGQ